MATAAEVRHAAIIDELIDRYPATRLLLIELSNLATTCMSQYEDRGIREHSRFIRQVLAAEWVSFEDTEGPHPHDVLAPEGELLPDGTTRSRNR